MNFFSAVNFFKFLVKKKPWIRIGSGSVSNEYGSPGFRSSRIRICGSVGLSYRSEDPDPYQNVTDPQHCCFSPSAGHIPAGHDERAGVPGCVPALPPAGLPSSPAAHRTGTGWVRANARTFPRIFRARARICKRLWSPGIDSEESMPLACCLAGRYNI